MVTLSSTYMETV